MTSDMVPSSEHDYIRSYERAVEQLGASPNNRDLQHQAVLSLARAGSLDYAISEYGRYGLSTVQNHEDIMALGARLFKDLYLQSSGKTALSNARKAADKYETAFETTRGYYSGINAATMALMAERPNDIIHSKAEAIRQVLPKPGELSSEERYFIEATRAESYLLLGKFPSAMETLQKAINHDPLNYTAHATTLKQFRMILEKTGVNSDWLSEFNPPRSIHFAGHIFGFSGTKSECHTNLSETEIEALSISISDTIQKQDIGFGFGALAAGSDILIAESLLREGAELHLVFPVNIETFLSQSVLPFGRAWRPRFEACLEQASSIDILSSSQNWPDPNLNRFAGQIAMGQAVLRAKSLSALTGQLLIWNAQAKKTNTAIHAQDWEISGRQQIILSFPNYTAPSDTGRPTADKSYAFELGQTDHPQTFLCETPEALSKAIGKTLRAKPPQGLGVHMNIAEDGHKNVLSRLVQKARPDQVLISETTASILAFTGDTHFQTTYAGLVPLPDGDTIRAYSLHIQN